DDARLDEAHWLSDRADPGRRDRVGDAEAGRLGQAVPLDDPDAEAALELGPEIPGRGRAGGQARAVIAIARAGRLFAEDRDHGGQRVEDRGSVLADLGPEAGGREAR